MKRRLFCYVLSLMYVMQGKASEQDTTLQHTPNYSIHFSNPIGLFFRAGIKFEQYYSSNNSILFSGKFYYAGELMPFQGLQLGLEYRRYRQQLSGKNRRDFFYVKSIGGHLQSIAETENSGYGSLDGRSGQVESYYAGLGSGVGRQWNFHHFFIEVNASLKAVFIRKRTNDTFYRAGPGFPVDLQFNWGFPF